MPSGWGPLYRSSEVHVTHFPQAISLELFALYKRPKKFLENLEKTISVLREKAKVSVVAVDVHVHVSKVGTLAGVFYLKTICGFISINAHLNAFR